MKRIFTAINLTEEIKKKLEEKEKEIQGLFPEEERRGLIKWVEKENLHITLFFLGQTSESSMEEIKKSISKIAEKPFSLKLERITYGPPGKALPRLIWLEVEKKPELIKIAGEMEKEFLKEGFLKRSLGRPFSPHITLGRIKTWQWKRIEPEERPQIDEDIDLKLKVESIEIMESKLKKGGPEYKILESIKLSTITI